MTCRCLTEVFVADMDRKTGYRLEDNEMFQSSHLVVLVSFTILSGILLGESLLLGWEKWPLILVATGVFISWLLHIREAFNPLSRLWIYSLLMMATYFFYGIHDTSTFDLAAVMLAVMMLYTMTGVRALVYLCQGTFVLTYLYDILRMLKNGVAFDPLTTTRTIMHFIVIILAGWIARIIIDKWEKVLKSSGREIEELREGTERLDAFLASLSHELRTPVNAIIGITSLCIDREKDEDIRNDMVSVRIAGKRVANQVGDILDFSEIDRKHLTSNHDEYMLASVLYDFLEEIRFFIPTNLEVVLDVDSSIPRVMKSDAEKIKKIIRHLVFNSLCFTENGGIFVRFYCVREDYGVNLCIEVRDTGIGMEAIEQERVFEGFYKGDPEHSGRIGGLGLGIPIVQGFVKSLGGFMTMESKPGAGTTVKVCLPQGVVDDEKCLYVENIAELSIGLYFRTEKYSDPHVREFYGITVKNVAMDLGAALHWVDGLDKLRILNDTIKLTHVFIGKEEYEEDREFFEKMTEETVVIVVAHHLYPLPEDSGVMMMKKPFYSLPLIHYLEMKPGEKNESMERLSFKGARVLVVDDEPMNIIVALGIFGRYEIETDMAYSGFEAVEKCTINDYDLIFMDHMMPGMDGVEAMNRIRSEMRTRKNDAAIVAFTANAVSTAKKEFLAAGFDDFISKPLERAELERVLRRHLQDKLIVLEGEDPYNWECKDTDIAVSGVIITDSEYRAPGPGYPTSVTRTEKENEETFPNMKRLKVDQEAALAYCGRDEDFYRAVLKSFAADFAQKRVLIETAFENKDFENYEICVHALKSTSKTVGAFGLSELALGLEEAAKKAGAGDVSEAPKKEKHDKMMAMYEELVRAIMADIDMDPEEYLGERVVKSDDTRADSDEEVFEFSPIETV